jgi:hypothetical protein
VENPDRSVTITGMYADKLQSAVTALLDACYASDDPAATLHAELDRLWKTGEWSHLEFKQLHMAALQTVKMIADSRAGA